MKTLRGVLLLALPLVACGSLGAPANAPGASPRPRLPGESISRTRLCECRACSPASCCEDPGLSAPEGGDPVASGADPYDFSSGEGALGVTSCAPRCERVVFRTPLEVPCDARRPPRCCRG